MAAGRRPGKSAGSGEVPEAVDPRAPTKASVRPGGGAPERPRHVPDPEDFSDFSPDTATRIMPPTPSLEDGAPPAPYNPNAPTQAMNLGALPDLDDPFAARATEVEMPSFASEDAASLAFSDEDLARVDLRPGTARVPAPRSFDVLDEAEVVEISLSDMDPLSGDDDSLPELADDDDDEDTNDTVVNMPLPSSLRAAPQSLPPVPPAMPKPAPVETAPTKALPAATVVERRSYSPAALFDDDSASVTDPRREELPLAPAPLLVEPAAPRESSSDRTASRPSLVSQPSGDPALLSSSSAPAASGALPPDLAPGSPADEAPPHEDDSVVDSESDLEGATAAPDLSDVSDDELPPLLHKWKVVPTAIRALDGAPPPKPSGFSSVGQAKALQTVLWSPEDEAAARAEQGEQQRARNPFWAPTDAALEADDPLESTEAAPPSDPRMAAAAYIHDAVAYLRSLSHFAAHLDDEVRRDFEGRMLGANDRLRRALAVLAAALEDDADDDGDDDSDDQG